MGKNCLACLLNHTFPGPSFGASDSVGLGWVQKQVVLTSISGDSKRESLGNLVFKALLQAGNQNIFSEAMVLGF